MLNIKTLKEERKKHLDDAKVIEDLAAKEERLLTDEEQVTFDGHLADCDKLTEQIDKQEAHLKRGSALKSRIEANGAAGTDASDVMGDMLATTRGTVPAEPRKAGWSFGEYLIACRNAALPGGEVDGRLREVRQMGSNEGIAADGGFLVQTQHAAEFLARAYTDGSVLGRCRKIQIGPNANGLTMNGIDETSRADGSRWGGVQAYWLAEAAGKTLSEPKFRRIELNLKKLAALWYCTDELLQDSQAISQIASEAFVKEITFKIEDSIINGTGAGQPLGLLNSPSRVVVPKEAAQAALTIVSANIWNMYSRLYPESLGNAVWFVNQDCWPQIFNLHIAIGAGGAPMFIPEAGMTQGPAGMLMGRPIVPIEFCATCGTEGDIILADMSHYIVISKAGGNASGAGAGSISLESSIHVKFLYDETVYRWVERVDGQPDLTLPLTPYKNSAAGATLSPFVVLAVRA